MFSISEYVLVRLAKGTCFPGFCGIAVGQKQFVLSVDFGRCVDGKLVTVSVAPGDYIEQKKLRFPVFCGIPVGQKQFVYPLTLEDVLTFWRLLYVAPGQWQNWEFEESEKSIGNVAKETSKNNLCYPLTLEDVFDGKLVTVSVAPGD